MADYVTPYSHREEEGRLVYVDETFYNESVGSVEGSETTETVTNGIAVDYYLTMPGEITDSNADNVVRTGDRRGHYTGLSTRRRVPIV